ncbi:MAG: histidine kinase [Acidobacteria bacterium]|nr:histidine kinase [Acidobacteriota bacterium]
MRGEWRHFLLENLRYLPYFFWALLISAGLYLARADYDDPARLLRGLVDVLARSFVIAFTILVSFLIVYGALFARALRTGGPMPRSRLLQVAIAFCGLLLGLWLVSPGGPVDTKVGGAVATGALFIGLFYFHSESQRRREEALAARAALAEARLSGLETQMRPHFLFNALNGLAELSESGRPEAAEMAHALADLYRRLLDSSRGRSLPLGEELEIVKRYLELEKVRYGERLKWRVDVPPELAAVKVPSLVVQTLVENAVRHGVAPALPGGDVLVQASRANGGSVLVEISNSGEPLPRTLREGTGLANTRERLDLLYGEGAHGFTLETSATGRTLARFSASETS